MTTVLFPLVQSISYRIMSWRCGTRLFVVLVHVVHIIPQRKYYARYATLLYSGVPAISAALSVPVGLSLALLLALSHDLPDLLFEGRSVISPHDGSIEVGWGLIVWIGEHGDNRDEDLLDAQDWPPSLVCAFLRVELVLAGWVQDRYAHFAVFVHVGVPHLGREGHGGWHVGEVGREDEAGLEEATLVVCAVWSHNQDIPFEYVAVVDKANTH
mmetsp:Transcript_12225/g.33629  ORF Transcript_12225/g.33629 Transcript_12225/m.33629 type:complete len:213 (-) Transcript_12225:446-1084(-)